MASTNQSADFDRFEALARRILTTPKAELMKHAPKKTTTKYRRVKKRK